MNKTFILPLFGGGGPSPAQYYTKAEVDALIADFITNTVDDLENYYLKSETYTQSEIQSLIGSVEHFIVVDTLPTTDIKTNVIYLLGPIGSGTDRYEEWIYSNSQWVKIGDTSIDLSNYYTKSEVDDELETKQDVLTAGDNITIEDNVISAVVTEKPYTSLERMGEYLYKITFETIPAETDADFQTGGGCTSFVMGGKLYRNLDWSYDETNEFLVVAKNFTGMALIPGIEDGDMDDDMLAQLPYHVNDGVNNSGIMVSSHILFNDWKHTYTGNTKLTSIPFHILTNLESIDDIDSLSSILADVEVNQYLVENEYLMQFLVSDGTTTYVISPGENGYEIVEATENPKLTNFKWVSSATVDRTDSDLQTRPTGIERWNMIEPPYNPSLEDLRFTLAYESTDRLSEFIGIDGTTKYSTDAELEAIQEIAAAKYATRTRNGETWQTVHSIVYASDGIDHLSVQENWDRDYFFDSVSSLKKELTRMSVKEQLELYDAFFNGGAKNWCDYTAGGYQVTDMSKARSGQTYGWGDDKYTTDGTEVLIRTLFETNRYEDENGNEQSSVDYAISLFSPTIGILGPWLIDGYLVNAEQEELLINLPTTLEGKQDTLTAGEGIDITDNVISATGGGGGGNDWYGTQMEFDALEQYDPDTNYFISDKIEYSEIKGAPNMANYYRKAEVDAKDSVLDGKIASKAEISYMTQEEFDDITPLEGKVYAIEGITKTFTVTYSDDTTETFNVVVD